MRKIKNPFVIAIFFIVTILVLIGTASASLSANYTVQTSFTDTSGNPITIAHSGENIYGLINVYNNVPVGTAGLGVPDISKSYLTYQDFYSVSRDNKNTWTDNDGTFYPGYGWEFGNMQCGESYWLKELFIVTGSETYNLTTDEVIVEEPSPLISQESSTTALTIAPPTPLNAELTPNTPKDSSTKSAEGLFSTVSTFDIAETLPVTDTVTNTQNVVKTVVPEPSIQTSTINNIDSSVLKTNEASIQTLFTPNLTKMYTTSTELNIVYLLNPLLLFILLVLMFALI